MTRVISFSYSLHDEVVVEPKHLRYYGRVTRCIWDGYEKIYEVEYIADGDIKRREFYEHQITH